MLPILISCLSLACAPALAGPVPPYPALGTFAPDTVRLIIVATTDVHAYVTGWDYAFEQPHPGGLTRVATVVDSLRKRYGDMVALVDAGDLIQGNPLGDYVAVEQRLQPGQVHPVYRAMAQLGYAAATLGNHEFNYGLDFLRTALAGATFPFVTSNVFVAGPDRAAAPPLIQPFVLLERDFVDEGGATRRLRVGVIGFVPPQIMQWDRANLDGRVFAIDIVEAARRYVPAMRAAGADLVVAVAHSGLSAARARGRDENAAAYLAQESLIKRHASTLRRRRPFRPAARRPGAGQRGPR